MKRSRAPSSLHASKDQKTLLSQAPGAGSKPTVVAPLARKAAAPLLRPLLKPKVAPAAAAAEAAGDELFLVYEVFWTKRSAKKHKSYSDGE
jgi:hypothetical protein